MSDYFNRLLLLFTFFLGLSAASHSNDSHSPIHLPPDAPRLNLLPVETALKEHERLTGDRIFFFIGPSIDPESQAAALSEKTLDRVLALSFDPSTQETSIFLGIGLTDLEDSAEKLEENFGEMARSHLDQAIRSTARSILQKLDSPVIEQNPLDEAPTRGGPLIREPGGSALLLIFTLLFGSICLGTTIWLLLGREWNFSSAGIRSLSPIFTRFSKRGWSQQSTSIPRGIYGHW